MDEKPLGLSKGKRINHLRRRYINIKYELSDMAILNSLIGPDHYALSCCYRKMRILPFRFVCLEEHCKHFTIKARQPFKNGYIIE